MKLKPPQDLEQLCKDLGIGEAQLAKLLKEDRFKDPQALVKELQRDWVETRDIPRLLARGSGYASSSSGAMRIVQPHDDRRPDDAGEAVDEVTQRRLTAEARARERKDAEEFVLAIEDVRAAIRERMEASPEFKKRAGRSLYRITAELDRAAKNAKRRAA